MACRRPRQLRSSQTADYDVGETAVVLSRRGHALQAMDGRSRHYHWGRAYSSPLWIGTKRRYQHAARTSN